MSPLIASTLDELYTSFLHTLPSSERELGRGLAHALRLAPTPDAPWTRVFRDVTVPGLPLLLAEGLTGAFASSVREAATAHLMASLARVVNHRLHEGTVAPTPELTSLLEALRRERDEALRRLGAPASPQTDYAHAEQDAAAALTESRELLRNRAPVTLEQYDKLVLRMHATAFPAPLALAAVANCNDARRRVIHQSIRGLAMSLQARVDATEWEEHESRGASWAVSLMRHHVGGALPGHPAEVRRLVQGCGVLVRLLERTREHFAEVKRAAAWVGSRDLERWAAEEERGANMLARTEARSPGHAVQWKAQRLATVTA